MTEVSTSVVVSIEDLPPHQFLVEETGDWGRDNAAGRAFAESCLRYMRARQDPTYLGVVLRELVRRGRYRGVEVGFSQRIAEELVT